MMPIGSLPMPTDPSDPTTVPTAPFSTPVNARQITVHGHGVVGEFGDAAAGDTDRTAMQDKARVAAMSDAKHRARTYASAAGAAVGPVVSISEYATPAAPGGTASGSSAVAVDVTVVYQLV